MLKKLMLFFFSVPIVHNPTAKIHQRFVPRTTPPHTKSTSETLSREPPPEQPKNPPCIGIEYQHLCPTRAQQPTLQTLISHWQCEKEATFLGSSIFWGGGGPLKRSSAFPPVRTRKKTHFHCDLAPRFGRLRCDLCAELEMLPRLRCEGLKR